jgi:hypothetical protein
MSYGQVYIAQRTLDVDMEEKLRNAEDWRTRRQARSHHPSSLSRQSRLLVCHLGYLLVALGARLEAYSLPEYRPTNGELSRRRSS